MNQSDDMSMRDILDVKIMAAFQQPIMANDGYGNWDDMMKDYAFEHAGEVLSTAMIVCAGPTPDRFYSLGLHDNIHGLEDIKYVERNGVAGYVMEVDRGDPVTIFVFEQDGKFDVEII